MYFIDKSSIVTAESKNETYSLKLQLYSRIGCFRFPSKWIIDKQIAITKQNIIRRTISKLGEGKARPKKELFNAVNGKFLLTYLLIDSINGL